MQNRYANTICRALFMRQHEQGFLNLPKVRHLLYEVFYIGICFHFDSSYPEPQEFKGLH